MENISKEPSIEDVLKELKQGSLSADPQKEKRAVEDSALQKLKDVLHQADAQAQGVEGSEKTQQEQLMGVQEKEYPSPSFNENFLKLEKIIKDLKK